MPCETITITVEENPNISIISFDASGGQNQGEVSYTLTNSGNAYGTRTVEVTVNGEVVSTQSYGVAAGSRKSDSVSLSFDYSSNQDVKVCARLA